jgi:transposase
MLYPNLNNMAYLFRKNKGGKIVWYVGESKRTGNKVRRVWQKYLGPADKIADQLAHGTVPHEIDVLEFGLCSTLLCLNKELGFVECVNKVISKRNQGLTYGEHLLITLINRVDNPQSRSKLGDWFDSTILKRIFTVKKSYLSSQSFWNHWNKISEEELNQVQEGLLAELIKKCDISDLYFDPTNFTTYIQDHSKGELAQFGYPKDGRKGFRQVNLSLLVNKKEGIPLWHHTYNGNINDVTEFKEFIISLTNKVSYFSKKCRKITLIFDKGNNSNKNINKVNKKLHFFIVGSLKPSEYPELFDIPLEEFNEEYITAKDKKVFCISKIMNVYDDKKKVVITYSNELAYKNRVRVEKSLAKALNRLQNLKGRIKTNNLTRDEVVIKVHDIIGRHYIRGLIKYGLQDVNGLYLTFKRDEQAYQKKSKQFGKNILFTDDLSLKTSDVVKIYNGKNIVEEQIKNLKDTHVISFTPMWCWTDKMIRVHAFTCVMALLFLRLLMKKVHDADVDLSQQRVIEQLKKIRLSLLNMPKSTKIHTKITRLNDQQRLLSNLFQLKNYY